MGALASNRKRIEECFAPNHAYPSLYTRESRFKFDHYVPKKPKFCYSQQNPDRPTKSKSAISRICRYPVSTPAFKRKVHAPCRVSRRFAFFSHVPNIRGLTETEGSAEPMGNVMRLFNKKSTDMEADVVSVICGLEELGKEEYVQREVEVQSVVLDQRSLDTDNNGFSAKMLETDEKLVERQCQPCPSYGAKAELASGNLKVEDGAEMRLDTLSLNRHTDEPAYKKLLRTAERRDPRIRDLDFQIKLNESRRSLFHLFSRPSKKPEEDKLQEAFVPLTKEEEEEVSCAFYANHRSVLVTHDNSSITITGDQFQCLSPGAWLNDEVINLYLELLKERERRQPTRFLKCHFFNTFFYKKLISGRSGYDYKSVRRWTSQRKLGYSLIECDKIFVPIHKEVHWCLGIINKKDQKFQYLDSLKGVDTKVLKILARYIMDEVKDKNGKCIDVDAWEKEYVVDLPQQKNGSDCGVFMIKYADFYSRGLGLHFKQENMPYFRRRTAKEILRMRAD